MGVNNFDEQMCFVVVLPVFKVDGCAICIIFLMN